MDSFLTRGDWLHSNGKLGDPRLEHGSSQARRRQVHEQAKYAPAGSQPYTSARLRTDAGVKTG